jgi:predicted porin
MFGVLDIGYGSHKTTNLHGTVSLKTSGVMDGSNAGSRFGFRGVEDLGGGLSASFHLEQGISPTSGDGYNKRVGAGAHQVDAASYAYTTANNRQTFLGLSSKALGTVRVGFQYANSYDLVAFNGLSPSEFQGGNFQNGSNVMTGSSAPSLHAAGSRANAITYMSNSMGGFSVKAQYGAGAGRETFEMNGANGFNGTTTANAKFMSLMGQYAQGPIYAALAYTKATQQTQAAVGQYPVNAFGAAAITNPGATSGTVGTPTASTATVNTTSRGITGTNIGLSYDFGMAKVSYVGGRLKGPRSTSLLDDDVKSNQYAVTVPVGAVVLFASTGNLKRTTGTATDADIKGSAFGARYNLSKRTTAYAFTGSEKNKAVITSSTTAVNYKDSKTVVGVSHSF